MANLSSAADPAEAATLRAAGVPVLEGTATGLSAFRHLLAHRDFLARAGAAVGNPAPRPRRRIRVGRVRDEGSGARDRWRGRLGDPGRPLGEAEALELLADWGIPVVAAEVVASAEEARAAAERIGWPVALKTAAPGVAHKSEVGGVRLGVDGPERLAVGYDDLAARLGPRVLVAMAGPGMELALGVVADRQFGPLVMVAAGGVLVEVLRDRRFALPPVDRRQALALLDRLAVRPLLDGVRGAPPADLDAVADAVLRLSTLAVDLGPALAALDVNPLIAGPDGCVAVDALVVPAGPTLAGRPRPHGHGRGGEGGKHARPALAVVVADLGGQLAEALPAPVLQLDPSVVGPQGGEADLDLGRGRALGVGRPGQHQPRRRLPGDHPAPVGLTAVAPALVQPPADPALQDHRLDPLRLHRVVADRPPPGDLAREHSERLLDAPAHLHRHHHRLDRPSHHSSFRSATRW